MNKPLLLLYLFLSSIGWIRAQTYNLTEQIRGFDLSAGNIFGIAQDSNGFVWLSTDRGVKYSDGIVEESLPDSIKRDFDDVRQVYVDEDGEVWVYQSKGTPVVYHFDLEIWRKVPLAFENVVEKKLKNFQVGVFGKGANRSLVLITDKKVIVQDILGKEVFKIAVQPEEMGWFSSFFCSPDGLIYLLYENGIYELTDAGGLRKVQLAGDESLASEIVRVVYNQKENLFYYLAKDNLYSGNNLWSIDQKVYSGFSQAINLVRDVHGLFVNEGHVYFFHNSQLYKQNAHSKKIIEISVRDELRVSYVQSFFVDREGAIWIGSHRGMSMLQSLRFQNFDQSVGLPQPEISAVLVYAPNKYVLGYTNGIQVWQGSEPVKTLELTKGIEGDLSRVMNFSQDKYGHIWFSAYQAGLKRLDVNNLALSSHLIPLDRPVSRAEVIGDSLYVVCHNKVYKAAIGEKGLSSTFEETFSFQNGDGDDNFIRKIGKAGEKWVVMHNGASLSHDKVNEIGDFICIAGYDFFEMEDTLLVGAENGLFYLEDGELMPYEHHGVKIENPVYTFLEDRTGRIWLGTNFGVVLLEKNGVRHFNEKNGLIGNDVNRGALCLAEGGRVFIGTENGISVYTPEEDYSSDVPPKTYIEKVTVVSDVFSPRSPANIPYAFNNVLVEFRAVSFSSWPHLTVSYMLEGLHDEWITIDNPRDNKLYFNNLPPGDYRLKLKSGLGKQNESEIIYAQGFTVDYPFFLQGWFIAIVVIVFVGLGILINYLFVQHKYQGMLENDLDRKTVEIEKTEDQFKNVWNSSEDGFMLSVTGGQVVAANPALCRLAGVTESELVQHGLSYLFKDPSCEAYHKECVARGIEEITEKGITLEMKMPFKRGEREMEVFITRMRTDYEGKPFFLNVFRDVTQKKEYQKSLQLAKERAEEVSKLKSNILSNMSHEIRTPLNGILGSAENILLNHSDQPDLASQVQIIRDSGERLLQTMNAILDLSKIQSDKQEIDYQETNINDFLSKILIPLKSLGIKKGILVTVKHQTKPFIGKIECNYFEMIVNQVVNNAIKYSDSGMVTVWLERKDSKLFLSVTDQGIGISEEYLEKIFVPFEQESRGYDRKFEGAGLGLAVTKHLLDQLSGTVAVDSEKGNGTKVTIEIPLGT